MTIKKNKLFAPTKFYSQELGYYIYLPENYKKVRLPLVLFLHGAGERGKDLGLIETHGLPKLIKKGENFPFITVAPQCPSHLWWSDPTSVDFLSLLIDEVALLDFVDENRIYCTGLSMGGYGTLALSIKRPKLFSAIIPICGGVDIQNYFNLQNLKNIPIWMFHGDQDDIIPLKNSEEIYQKLKSKNKNIKLTVYKNVGHNSWDKAYDDKRIYTWMLKFKKSIDKK